MTARSSRGRRRSAALVAPLVLAAALLAGCGEDGGTTAADPAASASPSPTPTSSATASASTSVDASPLPADEGPACSDVWVDGETLPGGYDGCWEDGRRVEPDGRYCEFGKPLITHDGRFWSVPGGRISEVRGELADDAGYRDALAKCSA